MAYTEGQRLTYGDIFKITNVWITWFCDRLTTMSEKYDTYIPILNRITKLSDEFLEKWEQEMIDKLPEGER